MGLWDKILRRKKPEAAELSPPKIQEPVAMPSPKEHPKKKAAKAAPKAPPRAAKPAARPAKPPRAAKPARAPKPVRAPARPRAKGGKKEAGFSPKSLLLQMRRELLGEINKAVQTESEPGRFEIGDAYDQASRERERDLGLMLSERDQRKLTEIDDALRRIEEGTYGICEECGSEIGSGRLKVMPFARVCVDCKGKIEREEVLKRTAEEGLSGSLTLGSESEEEET